MVAGAAFLGRRGVRVESLFEGSHVEFEETGQLAEGGRVHTLMSSWGAHARGQSQTFRLNILMAFALMIAARSSSVISRVFMNSTPSLIQL